MMARRTVGRQIGTVLLAVPLVFLALAVGLLVMALFQSPGQPVAVISAGGANAALRTVAAADGYILQVKGEVVIAISDDAGFVPRLYREGALAVAAASTGGCIVAAPDTGFVRRLLSPAASGAPSV